jgi:hypothetical protein
MEGNRIPHIKIVYRLSIHRIGSIKYFGPRLAFKVATNPRNAIESNLFFIVINLYYKGQMI